MKEEVDGLGLWRRSCSSVAPFKPAVAATTRLPGPGVVAAALPSAMEITGAVVLLALKG